jgi:Fic family protein
MLCGWRIKFARALLIKTGRAHLESGQRTGHFRSKEWTRRNNCLLFNGNLNYLGESGTGQIMEVYTHPAAMEPMFPERVDDLAELGLRVARASAKLSGCAHPLTCAEIARLVRSMNSYYSNLLEGHNTHPIDIERALRKNFSSDPAKRALQIESVAHIQVQELIEQQVRKQPDLEICAPSFLSCIHNEFYARLPEAFRTVKTKRGKGDEVFPGRFRTAEVEVGKHVAPAASSLPQFLERFHASYEPGNLQASDRIIAAASSHHRLTWIHPFLDGNGRVARLFTHTYLIKAGLDGHGLWTISRGFARRRDAYLTALAAADARRWNDLDGRGNLSSKALGEFCKFFLNCCFDQIEFMTGLLDLDAVLERIRFFGERWAGEHRNPKEIVRVLEECFLRGQITRGEAAQWLKKPERTARRIISGMLSAQLLVSDGHVKPLRLGLPLKAVGYYFPRLFPEGVEMEFESPTGKG